MRSQFHMNFSYRNRPNRQQESWATRINAIDAHLCLHRLERSLKGRALNSEIFRPAEDMVLFEMALMGGQILKSETLAAMWTPSGRPQVEHETPSPYGMGFGIITIDGQKYVIHSGGQQGTSTETIVIPAKLRGRGVCE